MKELEEARIGETFEGQDGTEMLVPDDGFEILSPEGPGRDLADRGVEELIIAKGFLPPADRRTE